MQSVSTEPGVKNSHSLRWEFIKSDMKSKESQFIRLCDYKYHEQTKMSSYPVLVFGLERGISMVRK